MHINLNVKFHQAQDGAIPVALTKKPGERMARFDFFKHAFQQVRIVHSVEDAGVYLRKVSNAVLHSLSERVGHGAPTQLQIEPTNFCNADCTSCSTSRARRERGYMSMELFRKIIDDASRERVRGIQLFLHGEPLLHPHVGEMIAYIKEKGIAVYLRTNGAALSGRKAEEILNAGVDFTDHLTVSILGLSKQVHENVMRGIQHDRVVANVPRFIEMRNKRGMRGPFVETIFYELPENSHEKKGFVDFWSGKVDEVLIGETSVSFAAYNTESAPAIVRTHTCSEISRMWVFWNGDVTLCGQDINGEYIFGNLAHQSISEVWNSEKLLAVRKLHKQNKFAEIPLCETCG